jgi:hypothetical protein
MEGESGSPSDEVKRQKAQEKIGWAKTMQNLQLRWVLTFPSRIDSFSCLSHANGSAMVAIIGCLRSSPLIVGLQLT